MPLRNNFPRKADFQKVNPHKKEKGSRWGIIVLFLGTILLSSLFWLKTQVAGWWQRINQPSFYRINKKKPPSDLTGLTNSINLLLQDLKGEYGVYFSFLKEGDSLSLKADQVFKAASVNKIPIMVSFYQAVEKGQLREEGEYILKQEDIQDYGAGSLRYQAPGTSYPYGELVQLMGKQSDNTATYVLANLLGEDKIQAHLEALGMKNTSIKDNTTTPKEMGDYLTWLYEKKLVGKDYRDKIFEDLIKTDFEERIPQGLPPEVAVAHKTGNEIQVYNDCGIIFDSEPYVLCVLTQEVIEEEALKVIPEISQLIWEFVQKGGEKN
jgi:beta-lactamase class A